MKTIITALPMALLLLLQTGCANRVVFATKTSLGLDVSGTAQVPDKVSLTYGRYEGAIVPRSQKGEPYSVYGKLDADLKFFGRQSIRQHFATGDAANYASNPDRTDERSDETKNKRSTPRDPLFFVTDTSYGLKLSAGKQDISPTLMLGYKRVEGAIIPVNKLEPEVRSVYADLAINSSTTQSNEAVAHAFPNNHGVRIIQRFATGRAADSLARDPKAIAPLRAAVSPEAQEAANKRFNEKSQLIERIKQAVVANGQVDRNKLLGLATSPGLKRALQRDIPQSVTPERLEQALQDLHPNQIHELAKNLK